MNREESRGQTLVLFALFLTALLGGAALVVDVGSAWGQGREQQKVADAAALAGATAEANGGTQAQIIAASVASATNNGFDPSEVTVNIPPASGAFAVGGSQSGPLSANNCSVPAQYPCWVEVVISKPHVNAFAGIPPFNQHTWDVTERGVAVGGIVNSVTNGAAPLMFNFEAAKAADAGTSQRYCEPGPQCDPTGISPIPPPKAWPLGDNQFAWTTFCLHGPNCNVTPPETVALIDGGGQQVPVWLGMPLGPHNNGNPKPACDELVSLYPTGADLTVAISDENGKLIGFWVWHFDPTMTDCSGGSHAYIGGWFVGDLIATAPMTISALGQTSTFGQYVVRLVE